MAFLSQPVGFLLCYVVLFYSRSAIANIYASQLSASKMSAHTSVVQIVTVSK